MILMLDKFIHPKRFLKKLHFTLQNYNFLHLPLNYENAHLIP